jgi:hypothetical protein
MYADAWVGEDVGPEPPPQAVRNNRETSKMRRPPFITQIIRYNKALLQAESCKIDP